MPVLGDEHDFEGKVEEVEDEDEPEASGQPGAGQAGAADEDEEEESEEESEEEEEVASPWVGLAKLPVCAWGCLPQNMLIASL